MAISAKSTPPAFEGDHLRYRQVEARCHDFAKNNPGDEITICFGNDESGFWGHVKVTATERGKLSDQSLSDLRSIKRNIDDSRDYNGYNCYSITVCDGGVR